MATGEVVIFMEKDGESIKSLGCCEDSLDES